MPYIRNRAKRRISMTVVEIKENSTHAGPFPVYGFKVATRSARATTRGVSSEDAGGGFSTRAAVVDNANKMIRIT